MIKRRTRKENIVDIETVADIDPKPQSPIDENPNPTAVTETPNPNLPPNKKRLQEEVEQHDQSHLIKIDHPNPETHLAKREDMASKFFDTIAAVSANRIKRHFKNPVDVDYNPSICKDFHDSGYCSWGDTCIYAHDRTDYKRGWEIDKEWDEQQTTIKNKHIQVFLSKQLGMNNESTKDDGKCGICQLRAVNGVSTECEHLFCERCIVDHYRSAKRCPVCAKTIRGVFTDARQTKP